MKLFLGLICCLATATAVHAQGHDGFYADGSYGSASMPAGSAGSSPTTAVDVGYRWSWFGVEAGYADLGGNPYDYAEHGSADAFTFGVSGHWNLTPNWYLTSRVGALFWNSRYSFSDVHGTDHYHENGTSWRAGLGAGYDFNDHFGLGLNYDWYNIDHATINGPSLKAEYRF